MRALVTGADGQLGLDLVDHLRDAGDDVVALGRGELDVSIEPAVWAAIRDHEPDAVLHAAAWTDVDGAEDDPDRAHRVNALASWWLARACASSGATLVMVSTDYVFGGDAGRVRPYSEFDLPAPINTYGRSKAAGEELVRRTLPEHHIVRTSGLFGSRGRNIVTTLLERGRAGEPVRVVDDQTTSPTSTRDLAAALREVAVSGRHGTWHRTSSGSCTWFELAQAIYEEAGLDVDLAPTTSAELERPAPRPAYSVLSNRHAELSGLTPLPHWRDGLRRMLGELGVT